MYIRKPHTGRTSSLRPIAVAFLATCLALPVHAATSFPDYPLQTGSGSLPPNILFILDDSGSMEYYGMPGNNSSWTGLDDDLTDKYYRNNTIYYNPNKTYNAWLTADGVNRYTTGVTLEHVWNHPSLLTNEADVSNDVHTFFFPHTGKEASTNMADFDRYQIRKINGVVRVLKGASSQTVTDDNRDISEGNSRDYTMTLGSNVKSLIVRTSGGSGNISLLVRKGTTDLCTSNSSGGNTESCSLYDPTSGTYTIRLTAVSAPGNWDVDNVDLYAEALTGTFDTPTRGNTTAAEAAEITNYATWYSYFRTRMKVAKAGASEAFGKLGKNFRVGYDSIWNRHGATAVAGDLPAFPIPVGTDDGLFDGTNKTQWFEYMTGADGDQGTPLHGALRRAGEYYEKQTGADGPWGPQEGDAQLSCRQSFAILTTDGYWNNDDSFDIPDGSTTLLGNVDGTAGAAITPANGGAAYTYAPARPYTDTRSDTLADVAMHYWKRDLRDLANNVPTSTKDDAFWQHMSTFGISIGLQGTLNPETAEAEIKANTASWPNPWSKPGNTNTGWGEESARRIDDLLHATVNGRGAFVAANDPDAFSKALGDTLKAIQARKASGSNVASNGPSLNNGSHLFQARYMSGEWSGDVRAFSVVGGDIASAYTWSATETANANATAYLARGVFTWSGTAGVAFPTTTQSGLLARTTGLAPVTGPNNAAYIKGNHSLEKKNGGKLRNRPSPIGDIVNSSPFYVKDSDTVFVGANDGMLHALKATDDDPNGNNGGKTHFSYVPAGLRFPKLAEISDPDYQHHFFVDGGMDVISRELQGSNKNFLVGSLGRGGRGVFALDVTTPATFAASNVLWDKTFSDSAATVADADMGYVLGAPLVRPGNNGKTLAIVGNGIDSDNGSSVLFIYVMGATGALESVIKLNTNTTGGNGMAEPRAADVNNDKKVDYVYAGDLKGNLWKFDLTSTASNLWGVANGGDPLFVARDADDERQPITSAVALAREPTTTQIFVAFGTGRYVTNDDATSDTPQTQTIYSLIDDGTAIENGRDDLHARTIPYTGVDSKGRVARAWESYSPLDSTKRGWYVDLGVPEDYAKGERVVTAPFVRGRALWFSSIIPKAGTDCSPAGSGFLNAVDLFTGTNPERAGSSYSFIDVDGNGQGNDKLSDGNPSDNDHYITSVDVGVGMPAQGTGVGNNIYVCGSDAECGRAPTPPGGGDAKRLNWRELFKRD